MRLLMRLGFAFALLLFVTALALAHPHSHGKGYRDSELSWAIIDDDHNHSSNLDEMDEIEDLKPRFGDEFLYIRDGKERFVITNRDLIRRAEEASHRIGDHAKEIKTIAKAQAKHAVSQAQGARARAKLQILEGQLEEKIENREIRGEEADELRRALERVQEDLEEIEAGREPRPLTRSEEQDLERRREEAQAELQKAIQEMRSEIRDILRDAKEKGLAERVR